MAIGINQIKIGYVTEYDHVIEEENRVKYIAKEEHKRLVGIRIENEFLDIVSGETYPLLTVDDDGLSLEEPMLNEKYVAGVKPYTEKNIVNDSLVNLANQTYQTYLDNKIEETDKILDFQKRKRQILRKR